jgi:hypothetical protein
MDLGEVLFFSNESCPDLPDLRDGNGISCERLLLAFKVCPRSLVQPSCDLYSERATAVCFNSFGKD